MLWPIVHTVLAALVLYLAFAAAALSTGF